jgi:hypothetical protein
VPILAAAQSPRGPRTSWGDPDLQGLWSNATLTPLQRAPELPAKPFFTPEEAAAFDKQRVAATNADRPLRPGEVGAYNDVFFERGTHGVKSRRTSLIVDPADGRIPALTPAAQEAVAARERDAARRPADGPEDRWLTERCILFGATVPMLPEPYNNNYRIMQSPGYVVILVEMNHDARVIPLDGRPRLSPPVRQWTGDSRGHWDGDTLVVESNGFNDKTWLDGTGHPHSESLRVTERLRRTDFGHIQLQISIDDPKAYVKSWTVPVDVRLIPDTDLLESVCHENELTVSHTVAPPRTVRLEPVVLARFVGTYDAGPGREFVVTLEGDQLFMRRPGFTVGVAMFPVSETSFLNGGAQVQFGQDPAGNITRLVFMNVEGESTASRKK